MGFKDYFSKQAATYAQFRPRYPREMFEYLGTIAPSRTAAWDCATGNGQAAVELAAVFERVIATDASEKQIANAQKRHHIEYRVAPAEKSTLGTASIDLIMVAQALHWFELPRFYEEVRRVLKPGGIFAASAYRFVHVKPEIDALVNERYYNKIVGAFWPPERALIENFEAIPFPLPEINTPDFEMTAQWKLEHLLGYLRSWSATQRFIAANGRDPLDEVRAEFEHAWGDSDELRNVVWSLVLRVGINRATG